MSRIISNYHEQAVYAQQMFVEMLDLTTQEVRCWRMFGIDVEWDGSECLILNLPGPFEGSHMRKWISLRPTFQQVPR